MKEQTRLIEYMDMAHQRVDIIEPGDYVLLNNAVIGRVLDAEDVPYNFVYKGQSLLVRCISYRMMTKIIKGEYSEEISKDLPVIEIHSDKAMYIEELDEYRLGKVSEDFMLTAEEFRKIKGRG